MKILFLGDVVGKAGRDALKEKLPKLKEEYKADFVIVNGENSAHGKGITSKIYQSFKNMGIDVITLGNHAFSKREIFDTINSHIDLIRPININPSGIGQYYLVRECLNTKIAVLNISGMAFIDNCNESPFTAMDRILTNIKADIIFVDFHGEATAEKITFFEYYKDKVTVVVGTHTHVQTADERIKNGCAFISDVGMCGAYDSILGRDIEEVFDKQIRKQHSRFKPAEGQAIICGVVVDVDNVSKRATSIQRIQIRPY